MSKKRPARRKRKAARAPGARSGKRRLAPIAVAAALGVGLLGAAVLWITSADRESAPPTPTGYDTTRSAPDRLPARSGSTGLPINDVDPVTGKPITPTSPTLVYKEHVIGFCCEDSTGYRGGWARMSEAKKDAFVSRYSDR
ncbi:MAG: hypothetical protein HQ592_14640 [Planctomycetes bacterium]|nr:hypothetical protein [Planctomycetota bacterium]